MVSRWKASGDRAWGWDQRCSDHQQLSLTADATSATFTTISTVVDSKALHKKRKVDVLIHTGFRSLSEKVSPCSPWCIVLLAISTRRHGAAFSRNQTRLAPEEQNVYSYSDHKPIPAP